MDRIIDLVKALEADGPSTLMEELEKKFRRKTGLGQLIHMYKQMLDGSIKQEFMKEAADGLLRPGIMELECAHKVIELLEAKVARLEVKINELEAQWLP